MSVINQELESLLFKYQAESNLLESQIKELKIKKAETDTVVMKFEKMLGIKTKSAPIPTNIHRKPEFIDMSLSDAVISVLRQRDGQTRPEIGRAIALPNAESIKIVTQSMHNAERFPLFQEYFNYSKQDFPDRGAIKLKKTFWLKENIKAESSVNNQPIPETAKPKQTDIFADLSEFSKRQVEKHYAQKSGIKA